MDKDAPPGSGAQVRLVDGVVTLMEVTADSPGAVLISAGQWLRRRQGTPDERVIEAIGWHAPADELDSYMLTLALAGFKNVDQPMP